jgi:membrane protease YdiL (CAAX protease family)
MTDQLPDPEGSEAEFESRPLFTPARALAWMFGAFLFMILLVVFYVSLNPEAQGDLVTMGVVSVIAFLLMTVHLIGKYPAGPQLAHALGVRPTHPAALLLGLGIGLCAKVPAEQLNYWIETWAPRSEEENLALEAMFQAKSSLHAGALLLVIAGMVPIAEEIFFRGAIYGALRRSKTQEVRALLVTAGGFAVCHGDLRQLVPLFVVALMLGALRTYTGSLLPGILAHVGFNAVAVLTVTFGLAPQFEALGPSFRVAVTLALMFLLAVLVRVVGRDPRALTSRAEEMLVAPSPVPVGASGD